MGHIVSMFSEDVLEGFDQQDEEIKFQEHEEYPELFEIYIEAEEEILPLLILDEEEPDCQLEPMIKSYPMLQ